MERRKEENICCRGEEEETSGRADGENNIMRPTGKKIDLQESGLETKFYLQKVLLNKGWCRYACQIAYRPSSYAYSRGKKKLW